MREAVSDRSDINKYDYEGIRDEGFGIRDKKDYALRIWRFGEFEDE